MSEQEREQQLHDWFAQRGFDLYFDRLGETEWFALALPHGTRVGAAAGEHGATKIEAAERLQATLDRGTTATIGTATETDTAMPLSVQGGVSAKAQLSGTVEVTTIGQEARAPEKILDALGAPVDVPEALKTRLASRAGEFGWAIGFAREPDGSLMWAVFDKDNNPLKSGVADNWDDAKLNAIEDLYPPSPEGSS
jgi:hypothetical protein